MELEEDLILGDKIKAIKLPEKDSIPSGEATGSGWGSISTTCRPHLSSKLQKNDLPVMSYQESLQTSNVCTGPIEIGDLSACVADVGGSLVIRDGNNTVQIGIVSREEFPCGTKGAPTVYTRISAFIDFINENVQ